MARTVRIKAAENTVLFNNLPDSRHHARRRFGLDQSGVIDLARGVVEYHYQIVPPVVAEPLVMRPVDMQHHPFYRLSFSPPPGLFARTLLCYQPGSLQQTLDPRITHIYRVFLCELLVIVPYVEIKVLVPIQPQYLLDHLDGYPPRARLAHSPVI